jgi:S1-C subfamily serine protease
MPERVAMSPRDLGFDVEDLPTGTGPGVRISRVDPDSPAEAARLREGMKVVSIGRLPVANRAEFNAAVAAADPMQGLPLGILRPGGRLDMMTVGAAGTSRP